MRRLPLKTIIAIASRNYPNLEIEHEGSALRQRRFENIELWDDRATHYADELYTIFGQEGLSAALNNPDYSFLLVAKYHGNPAPTSSQ